MQRKVNDLQKEFCELHNNFRASCKQTRGSLSWSKYARRMLALLLLQENHLKLKNSAEKLHKKREFHNSHTQKKRSTCSAVTLVGKEIKRGSPEFDPQKKRSKCSAVTLVWKEIKRGSPEFDGSKILLFNQTKVRISIFWS